ncbi:MAG: FRG domain-containing protein [Planctomycetota bacterium]|nr:FRG domain-containing protein [Planctomycetota bacterium]
MPATTPKLRREIRRRYRRCPINCPKYLDNVILTLGDFFAVFHSLLEANKVFWFRGHPRVHYRLAPSALRYDDPNQRERALGLVADMKRFLEMKLARPPAADDDLAWTQVAQHYGLPTRLLDWTQNAAVALFFACSKDPDADGLVVILNPIELNQNVDSRAPRVFNPQKDAKIISPYFKLGGRVDARGKRTIAINPTWNTERIAMQQGAFTLHGSRKFELDRDQASSLLYVPILKEHKESLLNELERVGIGEMFIFPEPEHVCAHLRRTARL